MTDFQKYAAKLATDLTLSVYYELIGRIRSTTWTLDTTEFKKTVNDIEDPCLNSVDKLICGWLLKVPYQKFGLPSAD